MRKRRIIELLNHEFNDRGEVKNKKKGKQKPRTLFHEGGKRK